MPVAINIPKGSTDRFAIKKLRYTTTNSNPKTTKQPIRPNSSPTTEKIKSVWFSGKKFNWLWVPSKRPLPNSNPEPIAILDWIIWYPAPKGSTLGFKNTIIRCFWYSCNTNQLNGNSATIVPTIICTNRMRIPLTKSMPANIATYTKDVPKSGCLNTSKAGMPKNKNTGNNSLKVFNFPTRLSSIFAKLMIIINFVNSDGWIVIGPIWIHRCAPSSDVPTTITAKSITIVAPYIHFA